MYVKQMVKIDEMDEDNIPWEIKGKIDTGIFALLGVAIIFFIIGFAWGNNYGFDDAHTQCIEILKEWNIYEDVIGYNESAKWSINLETSGSP